MRSVVAKRINCKPGNVFLVQNATDAINCLVKSIKWNEGDCILLPSTAYSCVRKTCNVVRDRYGVNIVDVIHK
jgi:selenocysteine lyase/cysteine desulfurase